MEYGSCRHSDATAGRAQCPTLLSCCALLQDRGLIFCFKVGRTFGGSVEVGLHKQRRRLQREDGRDGLVDLQSNSVLDCLFCGSNLALNMLLRARQADGLVELRLLEVGDNARMKNT